MSTHPVSGDTRKPLTYPVVLGGTKFHPGSIKDAIACDNCRYSVLHLGSTVFRLERKEIHHESNSWTGMEG